MDIFKFLTKLFGTKSQRDIKAIKPIVDEILRIYPEIDALSNDDLRAKTRELKQIVQSSADDLRQEIDTLKAKIEETPIEEREFVFKKIDKLEKEILERYEEKLNEVLPTAFAVVKSTCRRFKDSTGRFDTVLTATDFDREMAVMYPDVVQIDGDKALYDDDFEESDWNMDPYPCQLFGGVAIHQGKIAEMATGEGKTLTSTLPIYLNALTGNGVHVVTVNDYLAKRDARWNAPLYMFHELSVDCIDKHQPNSEARRRAYQADITYGTNNEFGFDYLRDNMAMSPKDLVQRMHNFAIVDEADSVLIDDARTPLIISGPVPKGDVQLFEQYQPLVEKLVTVQKQLATQLLTEAKKLIETGDKEQREHGFLQLFRSHKALPKNKPLIKFLSEPGVKTGMLRTEEIYMENNNKRMPEAVAPLFFVADEKMHSCDLTDKGTAWLAQQVGDESLFVLPDITAEISALKAMGLPDEERIAREDALYADYAVKSERIHTIQQLLKAYSMFDLNVDYVVMDGQVKIVDEQTGRIMEGRRWSDGLHQAVEAKEHVKVEAATQTFATITLQNYFRMYHKISGMTGTASTEAGELWNIYKLDVVEIPTNMQWKDLNGPANNRNDQNDRVYKTNREKYAAVIEEIIKERNAGRPTLVGTTSVEISELLSRMLRMRDIPHQVLNAKLH
ncbi:MAG: preprotein translocase subunit SecA, partial [Bacteroidaceae bacterium]|nr:preprotein translocase subunit SecA [Bacteroidaceae bacterium]